MEQNGRKNFRLKLEGLPREKFGRKGIKLRREAKKVKEEFNGGTFKRKGREGKP